MAQMTAEEAMAVWMQSPCAACFTRTIGPGLWYCQPCFAVKEEVYRHYREQHWGADPVTIMDAVARAADETEGRTWSCCAEGSGVVRASWLEGT